MGRFPDNVAAAERALQGFVWDGKISNHYETVWIPVRAHLERLKEPERNIQILGEMLRDYMERCSTAH